MSTTTRRVDNNELSNVTKFDKFILTHLKTILTGLIAALLVVNALMLFKISNEIGKSNFQSNAGIIKKNENNNGKPTPPMTQEQIIQALNKKISPEEKNKTLPISQEQISEALNKKTD